VGSDTAPEWLTVNEIVFGPMKPPFGQVQRSRSGARRSKPSERPVVTFCTIENEICAKANNRVTGFTAEGFSEDEGDQGEGVSPVDKVSSRSILMVTVMSISSYHSSTAYFLQVADAQTKRQFLASTTTVTHTETRDRESAGKIYGGIRLGRLLTGHYMRRLVTVS